MLWEKVVARTLHPAARRPSPEGSEARVDKSIGCAKFAKKEQNRAMATESIGLPGQLLEKVKEAAAKEEITPEEFVREAVETRLSRSEWRKTLEFGERNARERGLKPADVETEIAAVRSDRAR
jgi:predicted transcriptional regulator